MLGSACCRKQGRTRLEVGSGVQDDMPYLAWNRVYFRRSKTAADGVPMLLVEKVPKTDSEWTAVHPTGRVQIIDMRDNHTKDHLGSMLSLINLLFSKR